MDDESKQHSGEERRGSEPEKQTSNEGKRNFIMEVLEAHMGSKKTTNEALCQATGISRPTLNSLRGGHSMVRIDTVRKLARYFEWGPEEVGMAIWYSDVFDKQEGKKSK